MPKLILMFKNKALSTHTIEDGTQITIGRHSSNDLVIDNLVVSGYHAIVECHGETITLTDMKSTNGTYQNGEKILHAELHHNDVITIGKHIIMVDTLEGADEEQATEN